MRRYGFVLSVLFCCLGTGLLVGMERVVPDKFNYTKWPIANVGQDSRIFPELDKWLEEGKYGTLQNVLRKYIDAKCPADTRKYPHSLLASGWLYQQCFGPEAKGDVPLLYEFTRTMLSAEYKSNSDANKSISFTIGLKTLLILLVKIRLDIVCGAKFIEGFQVNPAIKDDIADVIKARAFVWMGSSVSKAEQFCEDGFTTFLDEFKKEFMSMPLQGNPIWAMACAPNHSGGLNFPDLGTNQDLMKKVQLCNQPCIQRLMLAKCPEVCVSTFSSLKKRCTSWDDFFREPFWVEDTKAKKE